MYALPFTCSIWGSMRTVSIADWLLRESQELEVKGWVLTSEYSTGGYGMPLKKKDAGPGATSPGGNGYGNRRWNCVWLYYFCPLSVYLSQDSCCCCFCHWNPHPQTRNTSLLSQAYQRHKLYILLPTKEEEGRIILNVRIRHSFMNVREAIPLHPNMLRSSCLFLFQWRASQMTQW